MVSLVISAGLLALGFYWGGTLIYQHQRRKASSNPPGPKGLPFLGNAMELATSPNLVPLFHKWAKAYGPIMQFSVLGTKNILISTDQVAKDLFIKRGADYADRGTPYAMRRLTMDLNPSLVDKNDTWRRERKFLHNVISLSATKTYAGLMSEEATMTLHKIMGDPGRHRMYMRGYCYSVLTRILFGFSCSDGLDPYVVRSEQMVGEGMQCFKPDKYPSNLWPRLGLLPSWIMPSNGEIERQRVRHRKALIRQRRTVEDAVARGTAKESVFKHFLENRQSFDITDIEADYTFDSLIGGGTRSTCNTIVTLLFLLLEYPEWQKRLQDSIDEVVGVARLPTLDDVPQLPVARAIVKEAIRYRSIVSELGLPRALTNDHDDHYNGLFFEAGTIFHANMGQILMEKETYPDQQQFNPARWLDPSYPTYREPLTTYPNLQGFASFGYGRRACPGYQFAEQTIVIMLTKLVWACTVQKPIDPKTQKPVEIAIEWDPVPNPGPLPFPCEIKGRDGRLAVVQAAIEKIEV